MRVKLPTKTQVAEVAQNLGMTLSNAEVDTYRELMESYVQRYNVVDLMPDELPVVSYPRTTGYRPEGEDNKLNAWAVKSEISGAAEGPLAGKTVAIKDNVMVAGMGMMNGSSTLDGYIPDIDATIVTRLLEAGATIKGKVHCECFCLSGGSHTSAFGPTHNPMKMGYSAGGSSSGSAAVVGNSEVDMAIGGDQGGSIRMPASYSGIVGIKPTWGLVPYTGVMPIEVFFDHTGPMTRTVEENALFLEVLAGPDGYDSRQMGCKTDKYTGYLDKGVEELKIGLLKEGFGFSVSEPDVDSKVKLAATRFEDLGAKVEEVSVPMHLKGRDIWTPIAMEGLTQTMMLGDGYGTSREDLYVTSLMDYHRRWGERADELSESLKVSMMWGAYADKMYGKRFYGKSVNLTTRLRAAYNKVLEDYDLLLMPTTPMKATKLPGADAGIAEVCDRAFEMLDNTCPFNITHHPAISLPCGLSDGLPIGLQLVGRMWEEGTVYQAANAFEKSGDWKAF